MTYSYEEQRECLGDIHKLLVKCNFLSKMHLSFGTLLGAVRQGKLNTCLNDWDDIDFSVNVENYEELKNTIIPELYKIGFSIFLVWVNSDNKVAQITLHRGSDRLDINILFPVIVNDEKYYVHQIWWGHIQLTKGLKAEYFEDIKEIPIEDLSFYGPSNSEKYLEDMYGDSWKTPCTSEDEYSYWHDSPGLPWWDKRRFINTIKEIP